MGMPVATYTQHENGIRGFPKDPAQRYAEFFRTSTDWLLFGRNPRLDRREAWVPVKGRAGANPEGSVLFATGDSPDAFVPPAPGSTERAAALEVVGHSMPGFAEDGALIYFEQQETPPTADMLGHVVIVETFDDEVLIKRLMRGSKPGLFDLQSVAGPTRHDVRIRWAAHVTAIIPPYQARRVIVRTGEAA